MEDSGYCSKRSGRFKFNSGGSSEGELPLNDLFDLFDLKFSDINKSKSYRYVRHGFKDEEDFEDFKQDLKDFRKLKQEVREEYEYSDPKRGVKTKTSHRRSRCISGNRDHFDPLMDFFKGDEHFQEFERVFDTISSRKRFSTDFDPFHRTGRSSPATTGDRKRDEACGGRDFSDGGLSQDSLDRGIRREKTGKTENSRNSYRSSIGRPFEDLFPDLNIDDSFMDFFNNDEDFKAFECEFEKFKSNRRSRVFDDLNRRSSCDIFGDVKAFCDRSLQNSRSNLSNSKQNLNSSEPEMKGKSSTSSESLKDTDPCMWNSAEEWDFVLNKLKRNSRLISDKGPPPNSDIFSDKPIFVHKIKVEESPRKGCDCQYTCHHNCVTSVTLDCTSVSQGDDSPEEHHDTSAAVETSLSEPKLKNSPKISISKNNVLQTSKSDDLSQTLAQLPSTSGPGMAQRVANGVESSSDSSTQPSVDNLADAPADNTNEKDETDSGYRSGTIPDEKLPKKSPSRDTLSRDEMRKKLAEFNHWVPGSEFEFMEDRGNAFQGFIKVTLNFVRPITMSLSMRPPSIYDLLTKEHIVEQNTQSVAFYMPRDTIKSIHVESTTTTKEVIAALLKKFHILDHPRKFAMYQQEFSKNRLLTVKRVVDKDFPLLVVLSWDFQNFTNHRLVLQENETGEIVWEGFSVPELSNFLKVLDREEDECISQLQYKYKVMKRIINQRLKEIRKERKAAAENSPS